ncbi:MAG: hypothetical protein KKB82_03365 [Candidatus Omnitrophica bacterium]|nr:hypothetical protein [Candidatus Omnitrophota bacterium]MBU1924945.1 hypothetical protein [Candidatus Omnitrophota bacterium]
MKKIVLFLLLFLMGFWLTGAPLVFEANELLARENYTIEDDKPSEGKARDELVSLDFKDADLKDVLKVFSQQSGINFIASKEIEVRKITLFINEVTIEDALKTLLDANNLGLKQHPGSNILIVRPQAAPPVETITRIYKIRYYHGNIGAGRSAFAGGSAEDVAKGASESSGDLSDILRPLLSPQGTIMTNSNMAIITDVPERFKLIEQVLNELDKPIPEVMIEIEFIETTADFLERLGMQWGAEWARYSGPGTVTAFPYTRWEDTVKSGAKSAAGTDFHYGLMSSQNLGWVLEMLETDTNTKFLSKPRILVQDREWAELKITANQIVSLNETRSADTGDITLEIERMDVGTTLKLLPIINNQEKFVSLLLEPKISRAIDSRFTTSSGQTMYDPHERSLRTVVMVKDGETLAIGGFITTEDQKTKSKVPFFGDMPVVGAFFRHNTTTKVDRELLIFITPRIVNPSERMNMWIEDAVASIAEKEKPIAALKEEPGEKTDKTVQEREEVLEKVIEEKTKEMEGKTADTKASEASFREQENYQNSEIDLTLNNTKASSVINLVE